MLCGGTGAVDLCDVMCESAAAVQLWCDMTSVLQAAVKNHNGENNQFRVANFAAFTCFAPSFSVISMIIIAAEDNTDPSGVRQQLKGTLFY